MNLELYISRSITGKYQSAYANSLHGNSIEYHSSHPEAETALLIRAKHTQNRIAWQTEKPFASANNFLYFCWLGGIAGCQGGPHTFELWANDLHLLDLETTALGGKPREEFTGANGVHLRYEHSLTDMCKDHFGLFWLTLPESFYREEGLLLELRCADSSSEDWMMVFEYPFSEIPRLRPAPLLSRSEQGSRQSLVFGMDSLSAGGGLVLVLDEEIHKALPISLGYNSFELDIPAVEQETPLHTNTYFDNVLCDSRSYTLHPVKPRQVYILPYSHNDIGYTEVQDVVKRIQHRHLDNALDLISQSRENPFEAVAKWNLEVLWMLESWWKEASEPRRQQLITAIQDGFIGLNALFANPLTGLCNLVEIQHLFDLAQWFQQLTGQKIRTATATDIPGFVWSLLPALAHNSVRWFSIAPNAGDRTGFIYKGLGDKPFWWESPCGTQRVLTWVQGAGYSMFHKEKITANGIRNLMQYLVKLDKTDYPYQIVALPYTIGGDNGGPDPALAEFVADWNQRYHSPQLIISTHEQLFSAFEQEYGETLPVLRGDLTPYWEDGAMSTAAETVLARQSSDDLIALQTYAALNTPELYKPERFMRTWEELMLWVEHTWGAWNSVSDPDLPFVQKQWEVKRSFALNARARVNDIQISLCGESGADFSIFNSVSWARNYYLLLSQDLVQNRLLLDEEGIPVRSQKLGSDWLLEVNFTAGWQMRNFRFIRALQTTVQNTDNLDSVYENVHFRICWNESTGAISILYDKQQKMHIVSPGKSLGNLLYVAQRNWEHPLYAHSAHLESFVRGEICDRILFRAELEGAKSVHLEYLIYHRDKRIDFQVTLDKIAVRSKESLHLEFPFAFAGAQLRYDSAGAPLSPEIDQLPGMCRNFLCPTSYADISNSDYGLTIALLDAPLIEIGGLTAEQPWQELLEPDTNFCSYLLNNIWHTNYKADQEGLVSFRYSLLFHKEFVPDQVLRSVLSLRSKPLFCASELSAQSESLNLAPPEPPILVLSVQLIPRTSQLLILLLNASEREAVWQYSEVDSFFSNPAGEALNPCQGEVELASYQQIWLLVSMA